ncbi:A-kinase anchor protein 7-like [Paramacrobiotus metropolitanus]|uniref:A-kinase anchor protein 7-like n=1 Tax=Paramacrobiotus metropolitanus TaxID=2943436 RepID=UPI0024462E7A|nr:A-kinase anchor protein 7-like [Paramacrobiotus metropolitanus]
MLCVCLDCSSNFQFFAFPLSATLFSCSSTLILRDCFHMFILRCVLRRIMMAASEPVNFSMKSADAPVLCFPRLACVFPSERSMASSPADSVGLDERINEDTAAEGSALVMKRNDTDDVGEFFAVAERACSEKSEAIVSLKERIIQKRCSTELTILRQLHTTTSGRPKKPKLMPNYFLAVPVSSPQIHAAAQNAQEDIVSGSPQLQPALIPLATLHVTLMVMRLENAEDVARASATLDASLPHLRALFPSTATPLSLSFRGLDHFRHQILFISPVDDDALARLRLLADTLNERFAAAGLPSTDPQKAFTPHLTLMKLSRAPQLRRHGVKHIEPAVYAAHREAVFGGEKVSKVQLLAMTLPKDKATGYYYCAKEISLFDEE